MRRLLDAALEIRELPRGRMKVAVLRPRRLDHHRALPFYYRAVLNSVITVLSTIVWGKWRAGARAGKDEAA
ncbi:hypothetical protein GCM10020295_04600 [Streptomyces cinereospinus]